MDVCRIKRYTVLFSVCFCLLSLAPVQAAETCVLHSGWEEWKPYQYRADSGEFTGLDVVFLSGIFREMGCTVLFEEMNWKGALARIENGTLDFVAGASRLPERERYAWFSSPYRHETFTLIVRKEDVGQYDFHDLSDVMKYPVRIGATHAYYYGQEFENMIKIPAFRERVSFVSADILNYRMLLHGRIFGFLMDPVVAVSQLDMGRVAKYPGVELVSGEIAVMFSRKTISEDFVERFNGILKRIPYSGQKAGQE